MSGSEPISKTLSGLQNAPQAPDQRGRFLTQLHKTVAHDAVQRLVSGTRQFEQNSPAILARTRARYEPLLLQAVGQLDHRVVLELKLRSYFLDGWRLFPRHSRQCEQ